MKGKLLTYSLWSLVIIALLVVMSFVSKSRGEQVMETPEINIEPSKNAVFLTKEDVLKRLDLSGIWKTGMNQDDLNIDSVESFLNQMNEVEHSKVYSKLGGKWEMNLKMRNPICRVINENGDQFYLDDRGKLMNLSHLYTADVVPVTGQFDFWQEITLDTAGREIHNDTLITINKLQEIYDLTTYVCNDAFLSAQITQVHLDESGDFILIPRVGFQKIIIGKANDLEHKFSKLKVFYKKGINKVGWEKFKSINLKYTDQVVCEKY